MSRNQTKGDDILSAMAMLMIVLLLAGCITFVKTALNPHHAPRHDVLIHEGEAVPSLDNVNTLVVVMRNDDFQAERCYVAHGTLVDGSLCVMRP